MSNAKVVELGDRVKDQVTGFVGIAMGRSEFINKCERFALQDEKLDKDNKVRDLVWFDVEQLVVVKKGALPIPNKSVPIAERPNGPGLNGSRRSDAPR